jgi:DNA-binding transcriptional ArsR family regulator
VRTLRRPHQQGYHLPWLRQVREASQQLDLRPLWVLMPRSGHNSDFLSPPPLGPAATVEEELERVRASDPALVHADLRLSLASTPGALESDTGRLLLADPVRAVGILADLLEQAWHVLVAPHWPRLRALLEADILFHTRRLAASGLAELFDGLHPALRWDGAHGTLVVDRPSHHDRTLDGQGLLLMPSAFIWPEVAGGFDPPWQPTLVYPARGIGALWTGAAGRTPEALARLLGRARADVLCALAEPASTTALAHRLGLAPSSVSAHLKALYGAGLLDSHRRGHQVLYERTPLGIALATGGGSGPGA